MSSSVAVDPMEFRKALGSFATGVTIITTRAPDGTPLGLTVNSFNSVSLNPPLVLWSLANTSLSMAAFEAAPYWAVHVLATDQEALSGRFARKGEDKFAGVPVEEGVGGIPLLTGCTARFQCRAAFRYDGGDHVIFVGEVEAFDRTEAAPLVFHSGKYAHATRREPVVAKPRSAYMAGSFNEDFLGYLLGRSHFQFFGQIRKHLAGEGLNDDEFYVLASLTLRPVTTAAELDAGMAAVLSHPSASTLQALGRRGLVRQLAVIAEFGEPEYQLTDQGRATALQLISAAKAVELQLLERLGAEDGTVLKALLKRLLGAVDPNAGKIWGESDKPAVSGSGWTE
ncbi:MAG TPA: flavin reductase [Solimonas sp.]|nr:flavin reductase [Solimonas sp.]